jgi:hypothetical protein
MDTKSTTATFTHADFLEQAKLAQVALQSLLDALDHKDNDVDEDLIRFVINKVIKATVRHCLFFLKRFSLIFLAPL